MPQPPRLAADHGRLGSQAGDAERIERELELAPGAVIADGLEEQVQDAETFRDEQQVPVWIEEGNRALDLGCGHGLALRAASSSRSSAMRCSSWWSRALSSATSDVVIGPSLL